MAFPRGLIASNSRRHRRTTLLLFVALLGASCASSTMRFHFAAVDPAAENPVLDFYRVTVEASAGNSRSEFQTGYYDADALHQLYGQVSEAKTSQSGEKTPVSQVVVQFDPATGRYQILQQDHRFTVVYGTNADAVAQQIGAFASAEETGGIMGSLMAAAFGRDSFEALYSARDTAAVKDEAATALKAELDGAASSVEGLPADDQLEASVQAKIRDALQGAITRAGSGVILEADLGRALPLAEGVHAAEASQ